MKVLSYKTLIVWQKAYQLSLLVYRITASYPKDELYGMVSQMRRAALSIAANIAEGYLRISKKDRTHFYHIALGSAAELDCYILFSRDIGYISAADFHSLSERCDEAMRILRAFIESQRS